MSKIKEIFHRIENITQKDGQKEFLSIFGKDFHDHDEVNCEEEPNIYESLIVFVKKIFHNIDELAEEIKNDNTILLSVKHQKLLRTCFQLVTSLGVLPCLLPGLGISLEKRCYSADIISSNKLNDEQKYNLLVACINFFSRSYEVPVLKNIIITFHLSDYLAGLIQLSFAPLKKPGVYKNFVMTQEMYSELSSVRNKYINLYTHLVKNCFQPILMKELLVLQSVTDPSPPKFVKQVITNELSNCLLMPGGLLSLIRCFIESYNIDTGFEWKKINMICRIVTAKHGKGSEDDYLNNICSQILQILSLNNTHYLATSVACVLHLNEKYQDNYAVKNVMNVIFQSFVYSKLRSSSNLPGTVILTPQEVDHKVNILHACYFSTHFDWPVDLLCSNLYVLFMMGTVCTKNQDLKIKLRDMNLKCIEKINKEAFADMFKMLLFGKEYDDLSNGIIIEEYDAGIVIKSTSSPIKYNIENSLKYLCELFKVSTDSGLAQRIFQQSLLILMEITEKRQNKANRDLLIATEDEITLLDETDEQYVIILQLLSDLVASSKTTQALKTSPEIFIEFIEHFILHNNKTYEECITISLVLLNVILSNTNSTNDLKNHIKKLTSELRRISVDNTNANQMLAKEALSLLHSEQLQNKETACEKAISDMFDNLLPIRAHGIIELTKLINAKDPETLSKKHYIFCIFQEQLKDPDSYMYLAAINGLASLCSHCTEDVLQVLCNEFLQMSGENRTIETSDAQNKLSELRMKIGDIIVKVTKQLGDMAITQKTVLLNTMLCACRDDDPLIRTSALSNLAEIALVLHYKIGTIIYEVLLCIWSILETDRAIECRRAAVMVISSLIKGLGKETLLQLKEDLLPIYRTLKNLYRNPDEDPVVRLHAQIALEELNDIVTNFLFPEVKMEKRIHILDKPNEIK